MLNSFLSVIPSSHSASQYLPRDLPTSAHNHCQVSTHCTQLDCEEKSRNTGWLFRLVRSDEYTVDRYLLVCNRLLSCREMLRCIHWEIGPLTKVRNCSLEPDYKGMKSDTKAPQCTKSNALKCCINGASMMEFHYRKHFAAHKTIYVFKHCVINTNCLSTMLIQSQECVATPALHTSIAKSKHDRLLSGKPLQKDALPSHINNTCVLGVKNGWRNETPFSYQLFPLGVGQPLTYVLGREWTKSWFGGDVVFNTENVLYLRKKEWPFSISGTLQGQNKTSISPCYLDAGCGSWIQLEVVGTRRTQWSQSALFHLQWRITNFLALCCQDHAKTYGAYSATLGFAKLALFYHSKYKKKHSLMWLQ